MDTDTDLAEKQTAELEESIAAQSRIVQELKDQYAATAKAFLELLLKCRDDLRRLRPSHLGSTSRRPETAMSDCELVSTFASA
jgi:uncharacterized coiled-coil protein SlyX